MNHARLKGKVVIITGASSGIGKASASLFAEEQAKVVLADVDEQSGRQAVGKISASGGQSRFVSCDVSKPDDARMLAQTTIEAYGRIDALMNNAGVNPAGTVVDTSVELWDQVLDTNLKGVFLVSKFVIPVMKNQGGGVIVNVASVDGLLAILNEAAYIASKGGVISLTKAMAVDHAKDGIRVNCICPGAILTPLIDQWMTTYGRDKQEFLNEMVTMHPVGRLGLPEDVAKAALFLISDEASFITGATLTVDGGYTATKERLQAQV